MKLTVTRISSLVLLSALAVSCSKVEPTAPSAPVAAEVSQDATRDSHLTMGNPSGATTDPANSAIT